MIYKKKSMAIKEFTFTVRYDSFKTIQCLIYLHFNVLIMILINKRMEIIMNYKEFIDNILTTRGRFACGDEYKERHHIVPRCIGGTDDKDNLIDLYAKEHFEAHRLLALENPDIKGLTYAWWAMAHLKDKNQDRVKISAEEYEEVKKNYSKMLSKQNTGSGNPMFGVHRFGKYNPMYGKHLSDEAKEKLSNSKKGKPSWNKGKQLSESTKEKLRIANIGKRHSEESKKKMSESRKGERNWNYGKHLSKETKRKISEANSGEKHFLYGKHHSEETKRKISKGNKGKKISKEQREKISKSVQCIETNKIYTSIKDAQNKTRIGNSSIAKCCKGKYKTAGGFTWKYLYDQTKKDDTIIQGAISLGLITEEEALRQLKGQSKKGEI